MGLRMLLFPGNSLHFLRLGRSLIARLVAGVLASMLVAFLLFYVGGHGSDPTVASSSSSLLSWFFLTPKIAEGEARQEVQGTSSGKVLVSDGGTNVEGAKKREFAEEAKVSENAPSRSPVGNDTQDRSNVLKHGGDPGNLVDWNITSAGNGTGSAKGVVFVKPSVEWSPSGKRTTSNLTHPTSLSIDDSNTSIAIVGIIEEGENVTSFSNGTLGVSERQVVAGHPSSSPRRCDIFQGTWVRDESKPYYPPRSCPLIDEGFDCHRNGRPDYGFLKWRWQPDDCDIPSLNATDFLKRLRGQRLVFVGDSLSRNMWESLVCILRQSVKNKRNVYERSGKRRFKTESRTSFVFKDYDCSVDFVRSTFLVREYITSVNGKKDEKLRLDVMDETTPAYRDADIVVFNTGHWWTHEKTSRGIDYYQEGGHVYPVLQVLEAYKKALLTWAKWVDKNINPKKTQVVFRGYSLIHFRWRQQNSRGQCHKQTEPIYNESFVDKYPAKMKVLDQVLKQMKTPVIYLNISKLTGYRKDGHPSIYRQIYATAEEKMNAENTQDCSHWCLPGVPDTWNELLYASLLVAGRGRWRK